MSWSLRFAEPIVLDDGAQLASLRQAIAHLVKTDAAEHGGPVEFARIATLQALNRRIERTFDPERKNPPWGRRKLKRDTHETHPSVRPAYA